MLSGLTAETLAMLEAETTTANEMKRLMKRVTIESGGGVKKSGQAFRLRREIEAMRYVREHTSLPVPEVIKVSVAQEGDGTIADKDDRESGWFVMERLDGMQMDAAWPIMSDNARAEAERQLKEYLAELHQLKSDVPGFIGSCSGGPAYDHRLDNMNTCGPFSSVKEFNDFLVAPIRACPHPRFADKYRPCFPDSAEVVFTHADLSWENILVDPVNGKVTGILDWEMAGFWPEWWEFRKALYGSGSQEWWVKIMRNVMKEYLSATEADMDVEMF